MSTQWMQLHNDKTYHRQMLLVSIVLSILIEDDEFKMVYLNSAIISYDGTAASRGHTITCTSAESTKLLK
jgi:hypothetical protein